MLLSWQVRVDAVFLGFRLRSELISLIDCLNYFFFVYRNQCFCTRSHAGIHVLVEHKETSDGCCLFICYVHVPCFASNFRLLMNKRIFLIRGLSSKLIGTAFDESLFFHLSKCLKMYICVFFWLLKQFRTWMFCKAKQFETSTNPVPINSSLPMHVYLICAIDSINLFLVSNNISMQYNKTESLPCSGELWTENTIQTVNVFQKFLRL